MNDFVENHWWAMVAIVLVGSFALAFVIVWFPYGFVVGDLTINPLKWPAEQRAVLMTLWLLMLSFVGVSATS